MKELGSMGRYVIRAFYVLAGASVFEYLLTWSLFKPTFANSSLISPFLLTLTPKYLFNVFFLMIFVYMSAWVYIGEKLAKVEMVFDV